MKTKEQRLPQARRDRVTLEDMPGELLIYDLDRHKAHCLNQVAKLVWQHCDGETTVAAMARELESELGTAEAEMVVEFTVAQLAKLHLLEDKTMLSRKLSRRELVRKVGFAAAVSIPIIASITSPTPAQAASCLLNGATCTTSGQCCSALCLGGTCQ